MIIGIHFNLSIVECLLLAFFARVVGFTSALIFWWLFSEAAWVLIGFFGPFLGVVSHLVGDTFTYHSFQPLLPFSDREYAFGFCRASNKIANEGLMTLGAMTFAAIFLLVTEML